MTFFINYPSGFGDTSGTRTFLLDSLAYATGAPGDPVEKFYGRPDADYVGSDFFLCKGYNFSPSMVSRESTVVALKTLPSHGIHIITFFSRVQRYGLTVARGYFTADKRIAPDAYEENDFCHYVDSLPGQPNPKGRIHVSYSPPAFSDTMNIDNPFEIDWYRLEVPSHGISDSVLVRLQSRPFVAGQDSSDIDLYVLTVPDSASGATLTEVGSSVNAGSTEDLMISLAAGSYYLAVVDYAGVAMRYSLCIRGVQALAAARSCGLILPGPPAPLRSKQRPQLAPSAVAPGGRRGFFPLRRPLQ
jgi:hypothetical protein